MKAWLDTAQFDGPVEFAGALYRFVGTVMGSGVGVTIEVRGTDLRFTCRECRGTVTVSMLTPEAPKHVVVVHRSPCMTALRANARFN